MVVGDYNIRATDDPQIIGNSAKRSSLMMAQAL